MGGRRSRSTYVLSRIPPRCVRGLLSHNDNDPLHKEGWGHTPMERAVDYALLAQAHQLALFHHDPDRSDEAVDRLCARARDRVATKGSTLQVFAAAEGQAIELPQGPTRRRPSVVPATSARLTLSPRGASTVLIVDDDPDMVLLLETELHAEGVRVLKATNGESALMLARQEHLCCAKILSVITRLCEF
jgi:hypothetical protein